MTKEALPPAFSQKKSETLARFWSEFGELAASTGATNLGQGFPDWEPPPFVVEAAQWALGEGVHQYTRPAGHPALVEVIGRRYSQHLERTIDPMAEVADYYS